MTPEEQLVEAFSNWMWELIKPSIARIVRAAVAEAVEAVAVQLDEAAAHYEGLGSDLDPHIATALKREAEMVRTRNEGAAGEAI